MTQIRTSQMNKVGETSCVLNYLNTNYS